jgi:hypothetical protein
MRNAILIAIVVALRIVVVKDIALMKSYAVVIKLRVTIVI